MAVSTLNVSISRSARRRFRLRRTAILASKMGSAAIIHQYPFIGLGAGPLEVTMNPHAESFIPFAGFGQQLDCNSTELRDVPQLRQVEIISDVSTFIPARKSVADVQASESLPQPPVVTTCLCNVTAASDFTRRTPREAQPAEMVVTPPTPAETSMIVNSMASAEHEHEATLSRDECLAALFAEERILYRHYGPANLREEKKSLRHCIEKLCSAFWGR